MMTPIQVKVYSRKGNWCVGWNDEEIANGMQEGAGFGGGFGAGGIDPEILASLFGGSRGGGGFSHGGGFPGSFRQSRY